MSRKLASLVASVALVAASAGCNTPQRTCDQDGQGHNVAPHPWQATFTYMVDNATLQDKSISDIHFVPHSPELSGTGTARLDRMAYLLDTYGGTIRYETYLTDEDLIDERLTRVCEYLAITGCNLERVCVQPMISGGRGLPATEAMKILEEGTASDEATETEGGSSEGAAG